NSDTCLEVVSPIHLGMPIPMRGVCGVWGQSLRTIPLTRIASILSLKGEGQALPSPFRGKVPPGRMRVRKFSFFVDLFLATVPAWAGSDMSSGSNKIRRSDVNSGGSNRGASADFKLTSTVGTRGGSLFSGTTYFVYSGFSHIVSHPDTIE